MIVFVVVFLEVQTYGEKLFRISGIKREWICYVWDFQQLKFLSIQRISIRVRKNDAFLPFPFKS